MTTGSQYYYTIGQRFVSFRKPASAIVICEQDRVAPNVSDETKCWNRAKLYSCVKPPASDQSDDSIGILHVTLLLHERVSNSLAYPTFGMDDEKLIEPSDNLNAFGRLVASRIKMLGIRRTH